MKKFLKVFGVRQGHAICIPYTNSIEYIERYFILFKAACLNVNMRWVLWSMRRLLPHVGPPVGGDHFDNQKEESKDDLITNDHICYLVYVGVCIRWYWYLCVG